MKWYEAMLSDEFIDYFCDESNKFYTVTDGEKVLEPTFEKFKDVVYGITYASVVAEGEKILKKRTSHTAALRENTPNVYLGYNSSIEIFRSEGKYINTILNLPRGSSIFDLYKLEPASLSSDKIAVLIMYPFWSRMAGSWETNFCDSGDLKKYLLVLKDKHTSGDV